MTAPLPPAIAMARAVIDAVLAPPAALEAFHGADDQENASDWLPDLLGMEPGTTDEAAVAYDLLWDRDVDWHDRSFRTARVRIVAAYVRPCEGEGEARYLTRADMLAMDADHVALVEGQMAERITEDDEDCDDADQSHDDRAADE